MRLVLTTAVKGTPATVMAGFTRELFEALAPPLPKVRLLRFDGSEVGDEVHVELNFVFFRQLWVSKIVEATASDQAHVFVDEGTRLPFFLSKWQHRHRVARTGPASSVIVDDITYGTGTWLTDVLFYPAMWAQFAYRKPRYRKAFGRP